MKRISAVRRDNKIYLEPSGRTDDWLWVAIDPIIVLDDRAGDIEIGKAILETLSKSKIDIPTPSSMDGPGKMATLAGYSSWPAFAKEAQSVSISVDPKWEGKRFLPAKWINGKVGGKLLTDREFYLDTDDPKELGASLRKAFGLCQ